MVTALKLCDRAADFSLSLMGLCWIESWLVVFLYLANVLFFLHKSQSFLTQKVGVLAECFFLFSMNIFTISLIHFPTVIIFLCLYNWNFDATKSDFIWSNSQLSLVLGLQFLEYTRLFLFYSWFLNFDLHFRVWLYLGMLLFLRWLHTLNLHFGMDMLFMNLFDDFELLVFFQLLSKLNQ